MAWSRGFFRLWMVASFAWVVALAALQRTDVALQRYFADSSFDVVIDTTGLPSTDADIQRLQQAMRSPPKEAVELSLPRRIEEPAVRRAVSTLFAKRDIAATDETIEKIVQFILKEGDLADAEDRRELMKQTALMLLPPLAVGLAGLTLGWVLRGFRPS